MRWIHRSPVDSPSQRPVTRSFDVFFDVRLDKRLSKQSSRRWFETPSSSLWRHCNGVESAILHYLTWKHNRILSANRTPGFASRAFSNSSISISICTEPGPVFCLCMSEVLANKRKRDTCKNFLSLTENFVEPYIDNGPYKRDYMNDAGIIVLT